LREEFPALKKRLPCLWTNSNFISTCGSVSLEVVKEYISEQKMSESILVVKIKHNADLTAELAKAVQIANYAIKNRYSLSSKNVSEIGLPSAISNQVLRKYGKNTKCKRINPDKIKLVAPAQSIKVDGNSIRIVPLKLTLTNESKHQISEVYQIELDKTYAYVAFSKANEELLATDQFIGVDLNATSHCAVASAPSGKVIKLGKQAPHIHKKYKALRSNLQRQGLYKKLKQTKGKETRKVKNINHKISKQIVEFAKQNKCGIKLEQLTGIRNSKKNREACFLRSSKSFRYTLNSWSYYQLGAMIAYKALLQGIPVKHICPAFTSQNCSRCGQLGKRNGKKFSCVLCTHSDHADVNASFNIGKSLNVITSSKTEFAGNGGTETPMRQSNV
jgi:putative transposase